MIEQWRDIYGFEGLYQVSDFGRVKSLSRTYGKLGVKVYKEVILKGSLQTKGYIVVNLYHGKSRFSKSIHRLVMDAFIGETKLQVDHINGIKIDNRLSNLRYCTNRQNQQYYSLNNNSSSRYFGVHFIKSTGKWCSRIRFNGHRITLGYFINEIDANNAYQNKLKELNNFGIS